MRTRDMSNTCPVCSSTSPILLEHRTRAPLLQNRVWPDRASALAAPAGELDFALCMSCGFAWNRAFDPVRMVYGPEYNNEQTGSPTYRAYLADMVGRVLEPATAHHPLHLVEIGCGQGAFLNQLALKGCFASVTGFDPAWRGDDGGGNGVTIHRQNFGPAALGLIPKGSLLLVSRHTIEHIADPLSFLRAIRSCMTPTDRLFLETPDIEWIVATFQPQDLFYEHCSIFSASALKVALAAAAFDLVSIDHVFDEQYLWAEAVPAKNERKIPGRCDFASEAMRFRNQIDSFAEDWRMRLSDGTTYLWGAASKGVTFALLVDPDCSRLAGAIDINPDKIGKFMPCTGLPIVPPDALRSGDTVIVMNPNYRLEIAAHIESMGTNARLLSLMDGDSTALAGKLPSH